MKLINNAYETLGNEKKKIIYDLNMKFGCENTNKEDIFNRELTNEEMEILYKMIINEYREIIKMLDDLIYSLRFGTPIENQEKEKSKNSQEICMKI